jgi:hypothetical protein
VLEDGKPQPIVQVQAFARSDAAVFAAAPTPTPTEAQTEKAGDRLPARYVVLAIDDVHMEFGNLVRARKALERFLDAEWRSGTRWPSARRSRRSCSTASSRTPGSAPNLQSVQDLPRVGRAEHLYVQFQAYNAKRSATGAVDLVCQASVLRGSAALAIATPERMDGAAPGPIPHLSRIGLRPFEPGDYELHVTVTDRGADATATRAVPFTVE